MDQTKMTRRPSAGTIMGSAGLICGVLALIVALSGVAGATGKAHRKIHRGEIAAGAVTTNALAHEAVRAGKIAQSAVIASKLAKASVTTPALAPSSVTAGSIAPGSVHGSGLAAVTIHATPISDVDQVAENGTWTAGNTETTSCAPSEALLGTGFAFTEPGNKEVTWLQAMPFLSSTNNGVSGRFASNSGGTSKGQIVAICLS